MATSLTIRVVLMSLVAAFCCSAVTAEIPVAGRSDRSITLDGLLTEDDQHLNISGLAFNENRSLLVVGSDEGATLQVLRRENGDTYRGAPARNIPLPTGAGGDEIDIEAIAWGERFMYVIGSHSRKRLRVKYNEPDEEDNKKAKHNRKRLRTTAIEPSREQLFRLELDESGHVDPDSIKSISLRDTIANDDLLRLFQAIPSKENGIDIEGLAADGDDRLYVGFRGPVLRGNFVPVMVVEFEDKFKEGDIKYKLLFVNLHGRGIRDMIRLKDDEFLILAGPMGDGHESYRLYRWNGKDCVPGEDKPDALSNVEPLCEIPQPDGARDAKAEGIAILKKTDDQYDFMVVYDGAPDGGPTVFRCDR